MAAEGQTELVVPVPVSFFDGILPTLRDTELRLLLVVLRQLRVAGRERDSAWLTHRELCRRTGRAGEAVSAAVTALSERGLLEVRDGAGRSLATPQDRQQATGPRYFGLAGVLANDAGLRKAKQSAGKPKTIDISNDIYCLRLAKTPTPEQRERIEMEKERIRERLYGASEAQNQVPTA
jgi:hypothetical protein